MRIDEKFGVFWGFNKAKVSVEEVGKEQCKVFDELLIFVF